MILTFITARSGIKVLDEGINVVGVSTISTGVGTVHVGVGSTTLLVDGDARVTGILTIGSGSITLDPTAKKIEGIDEIIIGTGTTVRIHQDTSGEIAFSDRDGKQASVGIGTTVSINTTGIITATTFDGSLATSNLSGTITNDQLAGSIGNAKLANSSIAIGGITLNLGDTDDTPAFDLSDATNYPFTSITGIATVISGDTTPILGGNLNLNSKTINGTGNVNITGIITASSFSGDGSGLTGVASTDNIITGTAATFNNNVNISGVTTVGVLTAYTTVTVGTAITADASSGIVTATGINVTGVVTATTFLGNVTGDVTGNADTATTATNAQGLTGTPNITVNNVTAGVITASQLAVSGLSTTKDLLVTGITSATNTIEIKSNDSTPGRIDLYCETNNAHYARLQAPDHSDFGGNITVTLPASTGTLLLSDGSGASLTALNASNLGSGTIPDARFPATLPAISGANLTGLPDSGVGIQSESVRVGTGFTDIKITGAGITVVGSGTTVTIDIPSSTITRQTETSSGVTTDFTITGGYTVGLIDVFLNGVKQTSGVDFTASDGSTVTMTPFITDGDFVEFQKYDKLNIAGIDKGVEIENNGTSVGTGIYQF